MFPEDISINLMYDKKTNYFTSVIIEKKPFHNKDFYENHLQEGIEIIPIEEAQKCTYFKIEYFIRNFITTNYNNYNKSTKQIQTATT